MRSVCKNEIGDVAFQHRDGGTSDGAEPENGAVALAKALPRSKISILKCVPTSAKASRKPRHTRRVNSHRAGSNSFGGDGAKELAKVLSTSQIVEMECACHAPAAGCE